MINEKALFIGPHGENREHFTKMVNTLLEDVIQWRRNFHPNDPRLISSASQRKESFVATQDSIEEALDKLLGEMKQSLPFHSPRFVGHMHSDLAIPALLGYFTGILFNQNNVVGESSLVSTRKEIEFSEKMCAMVGFKKFGLKHEQGGRSWGHLNSGGTTAILEALWVARNLKYYPLSIRLLVLGAANKDKNKKDKEIDSRFIEINKLQINLPNGDKKAFDEASSFELFNLKNEDILKLRESIIAMLITNVSDNEIKKYRKKNDPSEESPIDEINKSIATKLFEDAIEEFQVQTLGVAGIHELIKEDLKLPKMYVSQTSHYSWKKNMDILGLGKNNVIEIKSDENFKMDIDDLKEKINKNKGHGIFAVVGIAGTTEESAIDPIDAIANFRKQYEKDQNCSFYFHIDGAWGGYFCSMIRDNESLSNDTELGSFYHENRKFIEPLEKDLAAISQADSIVIDPHKMGYVPYAVGAVFYSDTRLKDFIFKGAPYLAISSIGKDPIERTYLGGWTLEGSRSGAAALACAMSAEVMPLDKSGYGKLMTQSIRNTRNLYEQFNEFNKNVTNQVKIIPIYEPQTNIVCFVVAAPQYIKTPHNLNLLTDAIISRMSVVPNRVLPDYEFVTSTTSLQYDKYKKTIESIYAKCGVQIASDELDEDFELKLLRTVVLHPHVEGYQVNVWKNNKYQSVGLFEAFIESMIKATEDCLPNILMETIKQKIQYESRGNERLKILWIENKESFIKHQKLLEMDRIQGQPAIGKYLDITFDSFANKKEGKQELKELIRNKKFDCCIIDLNLADHHHNEWGTGVEVLNILYPQKKAEAMGIPILFSKFFNEEEQAAKLRYFFTSQFGNELFSMPEAQFLPKDAFVESKQQKEETTIEHKAINQLIKSLYQVVQKR